MTTPLDLRLNQPLIACELSERALASRRQNILNTLWPNVETRQELADGYAFRFPGTAEMARELVDFILVERQCCSFLQIELAFASGMGPIWLLLRGQEGVKQFVEAELRQNK